MAASLLLKARALPQLSRSVQNFLQPCISPIIGQQPLRGKKKKSGGTTKNKIGDTKKKYRGMKVQDGDFVHENTILATQYGMRWYPGEHVLMDAECTLRAAYDGIVIISTESLNPYPDSPLYDPVQNGLVIQKKFFHIIPAPLHGKFRLLSET